MVPESLVVHMAACSGPIWTDRFPIDPFGGMHGKVAVHMKPNEYAYAACLLGGIVFGLGHHHDCGHYAAWPANNGDDGEGDDLFDYVPMHVYVCVCVCNHSVGSIHKLSSVRQLQYRVDRVIAFECNYCPFKPISISTERT